MSVIARPCICGGQVQAVGPGLITAPGTENKQPQNGEQLQTDYAGLYAALAALVCEARAHLDNHNNEQCGDSLDKAKRIVDAQSAPVFIAR